MLHEPPDDVLIHTVECLLEVDKYEYSGVCHSSDCSMMIRRVAMWSPQDLSWQKPACSFHRVLSRAFLSLFTMIHVRILLGMKSSMIPHQLLHDDRSPFFGSFSRYPVFHSSGICSFSQIFIRSGWIMCGDLDIHL